MNARMEKKSPSLDITFCISECKNKCMRHISNYNIDPRETISMCRFDCTEEDIREQWETIQYFRENLDWFNSLGVDTQKLQKVLDLAERQIKYYG